MKGGNMKYLLFILLLVTALVTTGCVNKNQDTAITPADTTTLPVSTPEINHCIDDHSDTRANPDSPLRA